VAKVNNQPPQQPRIGWPWPEEVRDQIILRTQLEPAPQKPGDPKNPPLPSDLLLESLKTEGGVTGTRLTNPPVAAILTAGMSQRTMHRTLMRRALSRATKSKGQLGKAIGPGDLDRLPEARREAVRHDLEREESMLKLLQNLGSEVEEIFKKAERIGEEK
jgi:hypothetical protein